MSETFCAIFIPPSDLPFGWASGLGAAMEANGSAPLDQWRGSLSYLSGESEPGPEHAG